MDNSKPSKVSRVRVFSSNASQLAQTLSSPLPVLPRTQLDQVLPLPLLVFTGTLFPQVLPSPSSVLPESQLAEILPSPPTVLPRMQLDQVLPLPSPVLPGTQLEQVLSSLPPCHPEASLGQDLPLTPTVFPGAQLAQVLAFPHLVLPGAQPATVRSLPLPAIHGSQLAQVQTSHPSVVLPGVKLVQAMHSSTPVCPETNVAQVLLPHAPSPLCKPQEPQEAKEVSKIGRKRVFCKIEHYDKSPTQPSGSTEENMCCQEKCRTRKDFKEVSEMVKEEFSCDMKQEESNRLLQHLRSQKNMGFTTNQFNWHGKFYCEKSFSELSGISLYIIRKVILNHHEGATMIVHGNSGLSKFSEMAMSFKVWMRGFLEFNSQSAPDSHVQVLPHWLTRKAMYEMYTNQCLEPHLGESTFYQYIKKYFGSNREDKSEPQIRFSKYSSHSICDQCFAFNSARRTCKTENELKMVRDSKMSHLEKVSGARRRMEEIKQNAIQFPNDAIILQLDGMDNSKSYCPRMKEKTKKFAGILRLPTKIQGCIIYSGHYELKRKILFYLNHDHFPQSSNMIVSILYKLLQVATRDFGSLPKKLHVFADNCWRENKNRFGLAREEIE